MGDTGDYRFITHRGEALGAMMTRNAGGPPPAWAFYFGVDNIDAAARTVADEGGAVHHGPAEVPGGASIIVAGDPQGALFGLVRPRKP
jgi:predicted enzyme related to lactoylglutathione lyase